MKNMILVALALTAFACAGASVKKQGQDSRVGSWAGEGSITDSDSGTSRAQVTILYVDPMGVIAP
ncbi:MAG: hypothetical protein E6J84_06030 [Deltaproteobacteria bacterium]|nr:MAG: hypothetical protein E6J84_06030 [Deltaproteobacteria bacterium]TMA37581.1 MAG: hypothetical protein E6J82_18585 [Deltaproteobacteria bacterium]TMA73032.1 MAG: hypothetical protein E6J67_17580 [Deltaproteobacteria bacterium]